MQAGPARLTIALHCRMTAVLVGACLCVCVPVCVESSMRHHCHPTCLCLPACLFDLLQGHLLLLPLLCCFLQSA